MLVPALHAVLERHLVEPGVAPGATACVAHGGPDGWTYSVGAAGVRSARRPEAVREDSIYDLASVSKPIVAVCAARLHDRGVLDLSDALGSRLPLARGTFAGEASLELHLAHRAGLAAHLELYEAARAGLPTDSRAALLRAAGAKRQDCRGAPPAEGFAPVYSDLGYLLVGAAVEHATALPLDAVVERELTGLGLTDIASARRFRARLAGVERDFSERVVPTEIVEYRGGEVHGVVHDDNAFALGGLATCGHAGLFGTAEAVARFGALMVDQVTGTDAPLLPATAERLLRARPGGTLRAGFDGKSPTKSSAGTLLGANAFGHLGYTGTSLWCDPERRWVVALLCNRVSPTRDNPRITAARPLVHDALLRGAGLG